MRTIPQQINASSSYSPGSSTIEAVRSQLIEHFKEHGGHVGSNLGALELIMTLLREYDRSRDFIYFDTGHQSYVVKLLDSRAARFSTIRKDDGLSGFPDVGEDPRDLYFGGHGGSGVSTAVATFAGLDATDDSTVVCLVGDAAITEGVAFEALNNLPHRPNALCKFVLVLNDNGYSIEKSTGHLNTVLRDSNSSRQWFSAFGLTYFYEPDGHNMEALAGLWERIKATDGNCCVHVRTIKGHGLAVAVDDVRRRMHYMEPFEVVGHEVRTSVYKEPRFVDVGGRTIEEILERDPNLMILTQGMCGGNGLDGIASKFPNQFWDVGMSEQHSVSAMNGLAIAGRYPILAMHAAFLPRAFDQLLFDFALPKTKGLILIGRSGFAGPDGYTHNATFDLSYLRLLPGVTVILPAEGEEYSLAIEDAVKNRRGPTIILTPHKRTSAVPDWRKNWSSWDPGTTTEHGLAPKQIKYATRVTLVTTGRTLPLLTETAQHLVNHGVPANTYCIRVLKPFPESHLLCSVRNSDLVVTIEENTVIGGLGSEVALLIARHGLATRLILCACPDEFVQHGSLEGQYTTTGLTAEKIAEKVLAYCKEQIK